MERRTTRRSLRPGKRQRGRYGEATAQEHLRRQGFRILRRNVHLRYAEIDVVALEGDTLCFVEVRLRSTDRFGTAEESVDARKRRRLARAAGEVLARGGLPRFAKVRFDVISVTPGPDGPEIRHLRDAFRPGED